MDPFLIRALAAGLGVAILAAPLGCFVVWQRMAYFGETVAQASLIGLALGLALQLDLTASALGVSAAMALLLVALARQSLVPLDSLLGFLAHSALAVGVVAASLVRGPPVDLLSYLFGDIFAVSAADLWWVYAGGAVVIAALVRLWRPLLSMAVHEELAAAEGVRRDLVKAGFAVLLALAIAVAIKVVGILLAIAFLIMPAAAARPLSDTPERMALLAAAIAVVGVLAGIQLSVSFDIPGGPAIVLVLAGASGISLMGAAMRRAAR
ncbi:MAG: metal ABC transporter permease [Hyphomicrobiaceae bacterium]|nr:metal ABC transporter permease [Hyphomicrobiaceae bacterium]